MTLTIRSARSSDLADLVRFNAGLASETEDLSLDLERLTAGVRRLLEDPSRGRYLVAELDGRAVGCLAVTREWSDWRDGWFWWIQSVFVEADARRRGAYRALWNAVRAEAEADPSVRGVRLYVDSDNTRAQAVYEALEMVPSHYRFYELEFAAPPAGSTTGAEDR